MDATFAGRNFHVSEISTTTISNVSKNLNILRSVCSTYSTKKEKTPQLIVHLMVIKEEIVIENKVNSYRGNLWDFLLFFMVQQNEKYL